MQLKTSSNFLKNSILLELVVRTTMKRIQLYLSRDFLRSLGRAIYIIRRVGALQVFFKMKYSLPEKSKERKKKLEGRGKKERKSGRRRRNIKGDEESEKR